MIVYFIQSGAGGPIKIGRTNNVQRRLTELRVGCPDGARLLATVEGPAGLEAQLHARFSDDRRVGEWFNPVRELLDFIATLPPTPAREYQPIGRPYADALGLYLHAASRTQGALAEAIGTSQPSIHRYATGERLPDKDVAEKIDAATGGEVSLSLWREAMLARLGIADSEPSTAAAA